jgi:Fic family protein
VTNSFQHGRIDQPLTPALLRQLTAIYEFKGKQGLFEAQAPEVLAALQKSAIIESTESSNRIEGVVASPERVREIVGLGAAPVTRSEAEIAGYRDVLATIHASYPHIAITSNYLLQLHRDLYRYAGGPAGRWKAQDNTIDATLPDGTVETIFVPVPAFLTPEAMRALCRDFTDARKKERTDPLLLIGAFVFDFLCVHPFTDGNGRLARLLTTLLLYQADFSVVRYISIERIVEETKPSYYASLRASSEGWHEGTHTLVPWWEYFLGVLLAAYRELNDRLEVSRVPTKADRVRLAIQQLPEVFTVAEVERACPGVKRPTIKLAMKRMREAGEITCIRPGKYAMWKKIGQV